MTEKTKAALMSRLEKMIDNPVFSISNRDVCIATIAICMLDGIVTDEQLSRRSVRHQSRYDEVEAQGQLCEQQEEENSVD